MSGNFSLLEIVLGLLAAVSLLMCIVAHLILTAKRRRRMNSVRRVRFALLRPSHYLRSVSLN